METTTFNVPSISCSVCSNKIKGELKDMNGIENVDVNLKAQQVQVVYNPTYVQPQDIKKKISSLGYEIMQ